MTGAIARVYKRDGAFRVSVLGDELPAWHGSLEAAHWVARTLARITATALDVAPDAEIVFPGARAL